MLSFKLMGPIIIGFAWCSSTRGQDDEFPCIQGVERYPMNHRACNVYYQCEEDSDGYLVIHVARCPDGMKYNSDAEVNNCVTGDCEGGWDFNCAAGALNHPHHLDCDKFYKCTPYANATQPFKVRLQTCPKGRNYDVKQQKCTSDSCTQPTTATYSSATTEVTTPSPATDAPSTKEVTTPWSATDTPATTEATKPSSATDAPATTDLTTPLSVTGPSTTTQITTPMSVTSERTTTTPEATTGSSATEPIVTSTPPPASDVCPSEGMFPYPEDNHYYYDCYINFETGQLTYSLRKCPFDYFYCHGLNGACCPTEQCTC